MEGDSQVTERVVSQLLTELDGVEPRSQVIVLAATNRIDMVDQSILRSGRFGTHIFVPLPDEEEREEILKIHLRRKIRSSNSHFSELLKFLARKTEGFSGAELRALCDEAKLQSLRDCKFESAGGVGDDCFERALQVTLDDRKGGKR